MITFYVVTTILLGIAVYEMHITMKAIRDKIKDK